MDDKTVLSYLTNMQETGLLMQLFPTEPGNTGLRRPEKIFLSNTNLHYALQGNISAKIEIGTLRELFFLQATRHAKLDVFHTNKGDFQIKQFLFEVGGKNKTRKQIKHEKNAFLVKDDAIIMTASEIPLLYFGFLY